MRVDYLSASVASGNSIIAHDGAVTYGDLQTLQQSIGDLIGNRLDGESSCVMVSATSKVLFAIAAHYLLVNKISVFLYSPNTGPNSVPAFCDKVLRLGDVLNDLDVVDNPGYSRMSSIKPGSVLFASSGTTGAPKYVRFDNDQLINNAHNCVVRFGLTHQSRVLVPVPLAHMYGMGVGLLPAFLASANVCIVEKNNVIKLYDRLKEFQPDVVLINPTICRMLLQLKKPVKGRRIFISAGERLKPDIQEQFSSIFGPIYNLYGCTELGAIAVSTDERPATVKPLTGVEVKINSEGQETGEIWCKHNAGYSNYVDANGAISGDVTGSRSWYSTKDLGQIHEDGTLTVLGRIDNCINRLGFLVSLEEIESKLEESLKGVRQAIAFEIDNHNSGIRNHLIAVCEVEQQSALDETAARRICQENMRTHTVPDTIYFVNNLPRLGNGKPDRLLISREFKSVHLNQTNIV